eukprot:9508260-Heterocapsa_arctica.AAC.1
MKPPIRILGRTTESGRTLVWLREGSRGHAQRCVVRTGGAFSASEVTRAACARLGSQPRKDRQYWRGWSRASGREVNVFPYTTERAPQARAPVENDSAQLLFEAAVAGGVAGPGGTFSIPAAIYATDAAGSRGSSEARHICVMGTDQSAWPALYPSARNNSYVHPLTRGQLLIMHPT